MSNFNAIIILTAKIVILPHLTKYHLKKPWICTHMIISQHQQRPPEKEAFAHVVIVRRLIFCGHFKASIVGCLEVEGEMLLLVKALFWFGKSLYYIIVVIIELVCIASTHTLRL